MKRKISVVLLIGLVLNSLGLILTRFFSDKLPSSWIPTAIILIATVLIIVGIILTRKMK